MVEAERVLGQKREKITWQRGSLPSELRGTSPSFVSVTPSAFPGHRIVAALQGRMKRVKWAVADRGSTQNTYFEVQNLPFPIIDWGSSWLGDVVRGFCWHTGMWLSWSECTVRTCPRSWEEDDSLTQQSVRSRLIRTWSIPCSSGHHVLKCISRTFGIGKLWSQRLYQFIHPPVICMFLFPGTPSLPWSVFNFCQSDGYKMTSSGCYRLKDNPFFLFLGMTPVLFFSCTVKHLKLVCLLSFRTTEGP